MLWGLDNSEKGFDKEDLGVGKDLPRTFIFPVTADLQEDPALHWIWAGCLLSHFSHLSRVGISIYSRILSAYVWDERQRSPYKWFYKDMF